VFPREDVGCHTVNSHDVCMTNIVGGTTTGGRSWDPTGRRSGEKRYIQMSPNGAPGSRAKTGVTGAILF